MAVVVKVWCAVLAGSTLVGAVGCGSQPRTRPHVGTSLTTTTAHPASGQTRVVYVRPTTKQGSLKSGFRVRNRLNGGFCEGSYGPCSAGNGLYHWCWPHRSSATPAEVFCMRLPWERTVTQTELARRLPRASSGPHARSVPWGVEISTGARCVTLPGRGELFDGKVIRFSCVAAHPEVELLGEPDRAHGLWAIQEVYYHQRGTGYDHTYGPMASVTVAWFRSTGIG